MRVVFFIALVSLLITGVTTEAKAATGCDLLFHTLDSYGETQTTQCNDICANSNFCRWLPYPSCGGANCLLKICFGSTSTTCTTWYFQPVQGGHEYDCGERVEVQQTCIANGGAARNACVCGYGTSCTACPNLNINSIPEVATWMAGGSIIRTYSNLICDCG